MRRTIKNITVTEKQRIYIEANYNRMSFKEMARNLGISEAKVYVNMERLGLYKNPPRSSIINIPVTRKGFFDVDKYKKIALI